ncbi:hypothetical protein CFPG_700 [Candidatus Azobacteroides pseudotrichonymphae genomovar. CFP2]|uniref:Uncharacterized protein n=1 Tax=Azobacteroides pseudotrichonymphae genomovar. CFP2 TaxID=511995 RepID=B6YRZ1_AZOPC|nr:hypothetical protein CFPG_700 [Candidatus Azobacteroides pseudotrichonymphae genomovar. CFP2]
MKGELCLLFMGSPMGCFYMSIHNDVPMVSREGRKIKEAFFSKKTSIRHPGVKLYCIALWRPIAFRNRVRYMNQKFGVTERTLSLSGWNYGWKLKNKARQLEG